MKKNKSKKTVHLIGICGTGMSGLAVLLKEAGWLVTGSDSECFGTVPAYLKKNKIIFHKKYAEKNVPNEADLIVIGNNIPLSLDENPEKKRAVELGLKIESMPEVLVELAKHTQNILVVGSSGKSTCTALIAWCLTQAKRDPSYFIGAMPLDMKKTAHLGQGKDFVIEGDEYTSSKTDRRSKFLHFSPASVLLTSAAHDHINVFPTEELYKQPFRELVAKISKKGLLVYARFGKNNQEISKYASSRIVSYGLEDSADWYAKNVQYGLKSSFDLMRQGKKIITVKTNLLGKHNMENIIGAGALLLENKKITPQAFADAINSFYGIKNRIELKSKRSAVLVYEGFGSSHEKARSIFDSMRLHFPNCRIIAVFEPHAFSWRNRKFLDWYKTVFESVDEVIMLPATAHGKDAKDQMHTEEIWRKAKKYKNIHTAENEKKALEIVRKITTKNDVVVLVSSGTLFGLNASIPKLMEKMFPA